MIQVNYTFDAAGNEEGGIEADTIFEAMKLRRWLLDHGYYNVSFNREEEGTA